MRYELLEVQRVWFKRHSGGGNEQTTHLCKVNYVGGNLFHALISFTSFVVRGKGTDGGGGGELKIKPVKDALNDMVPPPCCINIENTFDIANLATTLDLSGVCVDETLGKHLACLFRDHMKRLAGGYKSHDEVKSDLEKFNKQLEID